ncbi:cytochrome-c peroxidase [Poseidonocella sp. HB161398]|uniref:cytochrome-c peroxidase n=1 Tax=Poseidonocella sp. HB161398 TaxID=2320855 RepID=UPI001109736E|nr:cytochrome c peroxidase [Poseidonocella sp. HB161398]
MTLLASFALWARPLLGSAAIASAAIGTAAPAAPDLPPPLSDGDFLQDGKPDAALVALGTLLFFDPVLSGNRNISCGTCHDPGLGTGDGLALGIGEGGEGRAPERIARAPVTGRVPRNAQPLYNIGARAYVSMFHDGRVEADPAGTRPGGYRSPARAKLPGGLASALEVQALFPVTSAIEMAGQRGENPVATAAAEHRPDIAWQLLAARLDAIPGYRDRFRAAFPGLGAEVPLRYAHVARALAAFQTVAFRSDGSPFDAVLQSGDLSLLPPLARRGLDLFYGAAGCAACHSGPLLTDHRFHAIAMPQIGPGKGHGQDRGYWRLTGLPAWLEDEGRFAVTRDPADRFAFRTPSLRNVALTGPWGHAGSFDTLEAVIRHHADPAASLEAFDASAVPLPPLGPVLQGRGANARQEFALLDGPRRAAFALRDTHVQGSAALRGRIAAASTLPPRPLSGADIAALTAFLETLTDPGARDRSHLIPATVPSGLPVQPSPGGPRGPSPRSPEGAGPE